MSAKITDSLDIFDRGRGTGSGSIQEDWADSNSIYRNEWGSTAATSFNTEEAANTERFERLYKLHNGRGESSRKDTIRQSHIINDARMFCSTLNMPKQQRKRVLNIVQDTDLSSNNFGGKKYEKILLGICSLVSDEALTNKLQNKQDPSLSDRLYLTDSFQELMNTVDMSSREHRQVRRQIREKAEYF